MANPYDSPFSNSRATGGNTTYYTKASGRGSSAWNKSNNAVKNPYNQSFNATGDAPNQDYSKPAAAQKGQQQTQTQQQSQQKQQTKPSRGASLLNLGKSFASSMTQGEQKFAQGIARTLPGGSNDLSAQQKSAQADQNNAKTAATLFKSGKISKPQYQKLTAQNAAQANQTSSQVKQTEKAMPTKAQIGLGAASTAADILSGGSYGAITKGAKAGKVLKGAEMTKNAKGIQVAEDAAKIGKSKTGKTLLMAGNTAKDLAPTIAGNAAAGGLNAAAAGGNRKTIEQNAAAGALFPLALKGTGELLSHGASTVAGKLGSKGAQETLHNAKVNTLLTAAEKSQPKVNAVINPDHVSQGLTKDTIIHTPSTELHLGSEMAGKKIDNAKVAQYTKQIKDGEPIEPVVVHDVNGQKVVVDGQHRLAAMQKLGITDIPTVEKLPGAEPKAPIAEPAAAAPKPVVNDVKPAATAEPPSIKAFGKTIHMTEDNGFKLTPTKDGGTVYSKTAMRGNNAKGDRQAITHYYTADGKNITQAQHDAMVAGDLPTPKTVTGETAPAKTPAAPPVDKTAESTPKLSNRKQTQLNPNGPEPTVVPIPEPKPVERATQEVKTSGSALNAETKAVQKHLATHFEDKAQYGAGSYKDEAVSAVKLVKEDPQKAMDIAMGRTPGDNTIHEVAVARALENKALKEKDIETLQKLATSPRHAVTSEAAQRLGAEGYGEKHSVVQNLARLAEARKAALKARTGKTADALTKTIIKEAGPAVKTFTPKVTKDTWNSFVESLRC